MTITTKDLPLEVREQARDLTITHSPRVVLEMPPNVATFVVAALRTYGALSAEKCLPTYAESAEALADKIDKAIWEAGKR